MMRIWLGKDERSRCEKKNGVYKGKEIKGIQAQFLERQELE